MDELTRSTYGVVPSSEIAVKSLSASNGVFDFKAGRTDICEPVPISTVYPSCGAALTNCAAMLPVPPGLFITTNGCPVMLWSSCDKLRVMMSVTPPGANGTTVVTGLVGKPDCAYVADVIRTVTAAARIRYPIPPNQDMDARYALPIGIRLVETMIACVIGSPHPTRAVRVVSPHRRRSSRTLLPLENRPRRCDRAPFQA